jgi:hypothetical protein
VQAGQALPMSPLCRQPVIEAPAQEPSFVGPCGAGRPSFVEAPEAQARRLRGPRCAQEPSFVGPCGAGRPSFVAALRLRHAELRRGPCGAG